MPTNLHLLFDYTDDDLRANRAGYLSARQQAKLEHDFNLLRINMWATRVTYPVVALLIVAYLVVVPALADAYGPLVIVIAFALIFGSTYGWWRVARSILPSWIPRQAIPDTPVHRLAGRLTFRSDGEHQYVLLNDTELQSNVDAEQDARLWQLEPNREYVLYRYSGRVVAVERVEG